MSVLSFAPRRPVPTVPLASTALVPVAPLDYAACQKLFADCGNPESLIAIMVRDENILPFDALIMAHHFCTIGRARATHRLASAVTGLALTASAGRTRQTALFVLADFLDRDPALAVAVRQRLPTEAVQKPERSRALYAHQHETLDRREACLAQAHGAVTALLEKYSAEPDRSAAQPARLSRQAGRPAP